MSRMRALGIAAGAMAARVAQLNRGARLCSDLPAVVAQARAKAAESDAAACELGCEDVYRAVLAALDVDSDPSVDEVTS